MIEENHACMQAACFTVFCQKKCHKKINKQTNK